MATLNVIPAFTMPDNGYYAFALDIPGYNTAAKINGAVAFNLPVSGVEAEGYTVTDIVLFQGTVNSNSTITWSEMPTNLIMVDNGRAFYIGVITSGSPFYIGFVKNGTVINDPVIEPEIPDDEPFYPLPPVMPDSPQTPENPKTPFPLLGLTGILGALALRRR